MLVETWKGIDPLIADFLDANDVADPTLLILIQHTFADISIQQEEVRLSQS